MMNKTPLNIILLGDPASGKATHGAFLAKKYRLYNLDMGRALRELKTQSSKLKTELRETLDKGKLTPTQIVRKILYHKIRSTPKTQGLLFNGTPKMLGEAKLVAEWLRQEKRDNILFIYLTIPLKETISRMTSRKSYFRGKFSKRPDDNKKALKNRLNYYRINIRQVVKFFKKHYPFIKISTLGTIPKAKKRLISMISVHEKKFNQN